MLCLNVRTSSMVCYHPLLLIETDDICIVTFLIVLEEFCRKYWFSFAGTNLMARLWFPPPPSFSRDADWYVSDMQSWTHLLPSQLSEFCCCVTKPILILGKFTEASDQVLPQHGGLAQFAEAGRALESNLVSLWQNENKWQGKLIRRDCIIDAAPYTNNATIYTPNNSS